MPVAIFLFDHLYSLSIVVRISSILFNFPKNLPPLTVFHYWQLPIKAPELIYVNAFRTHCGHGLWQKISAQ